jgi:hypothetical protein
LNPAYILRIARDWGGTLFIDVMDVWRRAERADSTDILLQRFQPGVKVPRVLHPEKGPIEDTDYFLVFGATILGTNYSVDPTLESRSLQIVMQETSRRFDSAVTPEGALGIRAKLLAYRARYLGNPLPTMPREFGGRFGELVQPLSQIIQEVSPGHLKDLFVLMVSIEEERMASKSESFEAAVLSAILSLKIETKNGLLPVKKITDSVNSERPDSKQLTPQKVGRVIRALGLKTSRATSKGSAALHWETEKIRKLQIKYGLVESSETSESSVSEMPEPTDSEVSDVSEQVDTLF